MAESIPNSNLGTSSETSFSSWKTCQLFSGLNDNQLKNLESHLIDRNYDAGDFIIKTGTFGDAIFLIEKGAVEIFKDHVKLGENRSGDYFGAMALMENTLRSADVIATTALSVKVLTINQLKAIESDDIFIKVLTNHMIKQQDLIRSKNEDLINITKAKLAAVETKLEKTKPYPYLIVILFALVILLSFFHLIDHI